MRQDGLVLLIPRTTLTQATIVDPKRNTCLFVLYIFMIISVFIFLLIFFSYQGHPELENLRAAHYQWLSETAQEEKAGEVSWRFYFGHCRVAAFEVLSVWYWFSTFLFRCRIQTLRWGGGQSFGPQFGLKIRGGGGLPWPLP